MFKICGNHSHTYYILFLISYFLNWIVKLWYYLVNSKRTYKREYLSGKRQKLWDHSRVKVTWVIHEWTHCLSETRKGVCEEFFYLLTFVLQQTCMITILRVLLNVEGIHSKARMILMHIWDEREGKSRSLIIMTISSGGRLKLRF